MANESDNGGDSSGLGGWGSESQSRTWGDQLGTVTTTPETGNISWENSNTPGNGLGGYFQTPSASSFGSGSYAAQGTPQVNFSPDMGAMAKYARETGMNFSDLLGRAPTNAELGTLSEKGFGDLYGVNPNNLEGQNVNHMLASSKVGQTMQSILQSIPGIRTIQSLPDLFRNPNADTFANTASSLPGPLGFLGGLFKGYQDNKMGRPADWAGPAAALGGPWAGVAANALQGNTPAAGAGAGSVLGQQAGGILGGQLTRNPMGALVGSLAGASYGKGLGSMFDRSLSDFRKQ